MGAPKLKYTPKNVLISMLVCVIRFMRTDILEKEKEIRNWVIERQSKAFICKQLKCKPLTLENWLTKMGISYRGNQGGKGIKKNNKRLTALDYSKTRNPQTYRLKLKLIEDRIKEKKCEACGEKKWMGEEIPLELHHKDGCNFNNSFDNLQILCPNCHAQTDNHAGKGVNGGVRKKRKTLRDYSNKYCNCCGEKVYQRNKTGRCQKCRKKSNEVRKKNKKVGRTHLRKFYISKEELHSLIKTKSFCEIGRMFNVSDNAIRKRARTMGLI